MGTPCTSLNPISISLYTLFQTPNLTLNHKIPKTQTGTGAKIGGFAGDALPVARVMASIVDTLISHPNVVNGAMLYWPMVRILKSQLHGVFWQGQMLVH